jgi:hypothetical protein
MAGIAGLTTDPFFEMPCATSIVPCGSGVPLALPVPIFRGENTGKARGTGDGETSHDVAISFVKSFLEFLRSSAVTLSP